MTKFNKPKDNDKNTNRDQSNKGNQEEKSYPGSSRGGQFHSSDKSGQYRNRERNMGGGKDHFKERSTPRSGK